MVSCDRLKPYFTPAERLSLYEPDPNLDPEDYECRGNKHLETLDRALPSPPSHRGRGGHQGGDDEEEDEENDYTLHRTLQGPRARRGHRPGTRGRPAGAPRPAQGGRMSQLPRPCPPRGGSYGTARTTPRSVPVPEPMEDFKWDRYDLYQNRFISSPVSRGMGQTGATRVAEARRQQAQQEIGLGPPREVRLWRRRPIYTTALLGNKKRLSTRRTNPGMRPVRKRWRRRPDSFFSPRGDSPPPLGFIGLPPRRKPSRGGKRP